MCRSAEESVLYIEICRGKSNSRVLIADVVVFQVCCSVNLGVTNSFMLCEASKRRKKDMRFVLYKDSFG